jgi:hypothetical protein
MRMADYPSHFVPNWSDDAREDALFHYTSATGLAGIFSTGSLWSTAYYCANDEEELATGRGVLAGAFRQELVELAESADKRIQTFLGRGVDPLEYAEHFEGLITSMALNSLCAYITCFCRPVGKEDFHHGLLSQWRGYGQDGGYAVQFSRKKLNEAFGAMSPAVYELRDIHYESENELKQRLLSHRHSFIQAFHRYLDQLAAPFDSSYASWQSPLPQLLGGPLESLLDYLVYTKNQHFAEERESRMCAFVAADTSSESVFPVGYFNRNGLLVPYISTPQSAFDLLACIDWVIVGPGPRVNARFKSISQLVGRSSNPSVRVRASRIPYTRL